jgi:hypothetical protein
MHVVPVGVAWDDPAAYATIFERGRAGLAWEVLRRDPAYWEAFVELGGNHAIDNAFVARWGLHFR